jgi:hypothetical protein
MFIDVGYFSRFRIHEKMVIPIRITHAIIQRMKGVIGSAPVWELILEKTTIPMMTTAMVSPRGILMDNFISFIMVYSALDGVFKMVSSTRKGQGNAHYISITLLTLIMQPGPGGYGDEDYRCNHPDNERGRW